MPWVGKSINQPPELSTPPISPVSRSNSAEAGSDDLLYPDQPVPSLPAEVPTPLSRRNVLAGDGRPVEKRCIVMILCRLELQLESKERRLEWSTSTFCRPGRSPSVTASLVWRLPH
jgi:hypothetical protein